MSFGMSFRNVDAKSKISRPAILLLIRNRAYELARLKIQLKQINALELAKAKSAYEEATRSFQVFWDTKLPSD